MTNDSITAQFMHLSMQHTDNHVLKMMKRKYDQKRILKTVEMILKKSPKMRIGADIIIGFPEESRERFESMAAFLKNIPVTHYHIFSYSKRNGTLAAYMSEQVTDIEKSERYKIINDLSDIKYKEYAASVIGDKDEIIIEKTENGICSGTSSHYLYLHLENGEGLKKGEMVKVQLLGSGEKGILCKRDGAVE